MNWFWLTMPPAAVVLGAWLGGPLWLAVKHPDKAFPLPAMKTPVQSRAAGPAAYVIALVPHRIGVGHPPAAPRRTR